MENGRLPLTLLRLEVAHHIPRAEMPAHATLLRVGLFADKGLRLGLHEHLIVAALVLVEARSSCGRAHASIGAHLATIPCTLLFQGQPVRHLLLVDQHHHR